MKSSLEIRVATLRAARGKTRVTRAVKRTSRAMKQHPGKSGFYFMIRPLFLLFVAAALAAPPLLNFDAFVGPSARTLLFSNHVCSTCYAPYLVDSQN